MRITKNSSTTPPRVSMTKSQLQSAAAVDLLSLCQTVTEDGRLCKEEIIALKDWLRAHRESDLPAVGFLFETVETIIADGLVTKQERHELYEAIKKVLPPEARTQARKARTKLIAARREHVRQMKESQREAEKRERERNRPLCSVDFMVAGVHFEERGEVIDRYLACGDRVYLVRDPRNQYSRNAIAVRLENRLQIGFVPEDYAVDVAPHLDRGCPHHASCKKILTGGRTPIPVVIAKIYRPDASMDVVASGY